MQIGDLADGFFYTTLILMMNSYSQEHTFSRNDESGFKKDIKKIIRRKQFTVYMHQIKY